MKKFTKTVENFNCAHCGAVVHGNGYKTTVLNVYGHDTLIIAQEIGHQIAVE